MISTTFHRSNCRSLDIIGYPNYEIDILGNCYNLKTGMRAAYRSDNDRYELRKPFSNSDASTSYPTSYLVKVVWYDATDEIVNQSPYLQDILDYREFMSLKEEDKVLLPYITDMSTFILTRYGTIWKMQYVTKVKGQKGSTGYYHVNLGPKYRNIDVHRLVAHYFCKIDKSYIDNGYTEKTLVVNHIDGNKENNVWTNLEWITNAENMAHASKTGLMSTTISDELLEQVWKLLSENYMDLEISNITKIPAPTVSNIRQGVSPRYRTNRYSWPKSSLSVRRIPINQYEDIIKDYNAGMSYSKLCEKYNTTNPTILRIINDHSDMITRQRRDVSNRRKERLSDDVLKKIFQMFCDCKTNKEVSLALDIPESTIASIRRRDKYAKESEGYTWPKNAKEYQYLEMQNKIIELYKQGKAYQEIAKELNISWNRVYRCIRSYLKDNK